MAIVQSNLFLLVSLFVPVLKCNEYCFSEQKYELLWPKTALGENVTRDCSSINSTWTGNFIAKCRKNKQELNAKWHFRGRDCGCEVQSVLQYYQTKVSKVNQTDFVQTAAELRGAFKQFINEEIYLNLMTRLKDSMCSRQPKQKSTLWDKIQQYCQLWGRTDLVERKNREVHFKNKFCQEVGTSTGLEAGVVISSIGGTKRKPKSGITVVDINHSEGNLTQIVNNVNSSDCLVTSYHERNRTITVRRIDSGKRERHEKRRKLVELSLISVSLVAIVLSLIFLSCIRQHSIQSSEKLFIHKNFLLSWGIGYAVYIVDVAAFERIYRRTALCSVVAVIRHFFQTAVFTWMLVEAVNLFMKLVKVISTKTFYMAYLSIGWGIPAAIVAITAAARPQTYDMNQIIFEDFMCGSQKFTSTVNRTRQGRCWLNGSKWLYTGPVMGILLVNTVIFVMLLKVVFSKLDSRHHRDAITRTRKGLKSVAALLPLLGVTWIFGLLVNIHEALDYIFILLTSTQGIVFCIFHCILDAQVRSSIRKIII
ncbi:unnamed protein product [Porites lobata]|uniref:G-protein coupled receptors family 2 profile 2 domain-containing protein n=1 Tax=Porites lobata TaxID=104759 RepID=A0ABN8MQH0_9CNID|nr:unnamed protein product [Porites lobata]